MSLDIMALLYMLPMMPMIEQGGLIQWRAADDREKMATMPYGLVLVLMVFVMMPLVNRMEVKIDHECKLARDMMTMFWSSWFEQFRWMWSC